MTEEPFTPYEFERLSIEEASQRYPHLWATIESTLHLTQSNIALMVSIAVGTCGTCANGPDTAAHVKAEHDWIGW